MLKDGAFVFHPCFYDIYYHHLSLCSLSNLPGAISLEDHHVSSTLKNHQQITNTWKKMLFTRNLNSIENNLRKSQLCFCFSLRHTTT